MLMAKFCSFTKILEQSAYARTNTREHYIPIGTVFCPRLEGANYTQEIAIDS